ADFYVLPSQRVDTETVLERGEFVLAIVLPPAAAGGRQFFEKLMQRATWDFSLACIAATRRKTGDVRLVLGGAGPRPWRVNVSIEEDVAAGGVDEDAVETLIQRALYDAKPLSRNGYKLDLAAALLRRAIAGIS
ncbi:MAG TPA: hypothetical protein VMH39_09160, partial [Gemmatimonadaceae bacterium]|nr:hypothetical protein [Gemmatimonadaceae bacterium]